MKMDLLIFYENYKSIIWFIIAAIFVIVIFFSVSTVLKIVLVIGIFLVNYNLIKTLIRSLLVGFGGGMKHRIKEIKDEKD